MYKDIGRERHYVVDVKIFREEKVVGTSFGHKSITSCFWKKKSLLQKTGGALARARSSTRHTTKKNLCLPFVKLAGSCYVHSRHWALVDSSCPLLQVYALIWDLNFKAIMYQLLHINSNGVKLQNMKYLQKEQFKLLKQL